MTSIAQNELLCLGPDCGRRLVSGRERPPGTHAYRARHLCERCWRHAKEDGSLADYPRFGRSCQDVLMDWEVLRIRGFTKAEAAAYVGMNYAAFDRATCRARAAARA